MSRKVYLGGDMLSVGQQMRREFEKKELERLGFKVYAPQDDKDINDKQIADQTGLAERIVYNDTAGIYKSDILIFDYLPHAQGTIAEMGYVHGLLQYVDNDKYDIYVQCTDVRQGTGHVSKEQNRSEFSINQYVYGVILDITNGRGIQTFNEICQDLIKNEEW
ncbi:nucleoside 2-deoxyribosyltransferase [Staphylococcus pettenkoferi]|uniref:nucleoside 2-deoxyribosyltransferase n=1 Tax=Staphylococcus pettenkoferi TaxID=170573 RepID=UPI0022753657|nr:nucleoside 2-deoxyribosyltransferase [Staphylococcus pettenkoferi]MCY1587589.1 nucleoside 2-deoxyribosyltransferase [Staphylococcus pettenkoferi]